MKVGTFGNYRYFLNTGNCRYTEHVTLRVTVRYIIRFYLYISTLMDCYVLVQHVVLRWLHTRLYCILMFWAISWIFVSCIAYLNTFLLVSSIYFYDLEDKIQVTNNNYVLFIYISVPTNFKNCNVNCLQYYNNDKILLVTSSHNSQVGL